MEPIRDVKHIIGVVVPDSLVKRLLSLLLIKTGETRNDRYKSISLYTWKNPKDMRRGIEIAYQNGQPVDYEIPVAVIPISECNAECDQCLVAESLAPQLWCVSNFVKGLKEYHTFEFDSPDPNASHESIEKLLCTVSNYKATLCPSKCSNKKRR